jgi:hypothetical protein
MTNHQTNRLRQALVVIAVISTIVVNVLANVIPFNGVTTGEVAARYDVLFQPAAYVFSIWWLIYLGLLAYAIYQARLPRRDDPQLRSLDLPVIVSSLANIAWIVVWHNGQITASFVIMLVLLGALLTIYGRLGQPALGKDPTRLWLVNRVFSVYLGWITVATFANLGVLLQESGWTGGALGRLPWFILGVVAVLIVAGLVAWFRADVAYLLVLVWAFVGIGVERGSDPVVSAIAWTATALLAALVLMSVLKNSSKQAKGC